MKKHTILIITLTFLISMIGCKKKIKQENYVITGKVTGFPNGTKFYLRNMSTDVVFDSTVVKDNKFQFKGHLEDTPEEIWLNTKVNNNFIYTNLLIGNENVNVKGDISDFPYNVTITGSKSQENDNILTNLTKDLYFKRDSLVNYYFNITPKKQEELQSEIWGKISKIDSTTNAIRTNYIKSHNTYTSVIQLGFLKNQIPRDTIQKIFNTYSQEIKESKYGKVIEVFLKNKTITIGDKYIDFEGLNKSNEKIKFSELKGNGYTLLNFTSSSCGACINSAPELAEIEKKYSDFITIVSFSNDLKKENWINSLKREKVIWKSIWGGKGKFNETTINYGIRMYPTFMLINPKGIVFYKWSGYEKGSLIKELKNKKIIE